MASAKNVKFEDALTKIRAGLLGEAEPLRVMGVALTAARVKEEAYASGIAKRGEELTEANKVEARMQIILADSIAMHGDAANTLDSSANQWVTIKAVIRDNATMLGQFFMPVFQKVLGFIRDGVNVSIDFAKKLYASSQETNRWTTFLGNVTTILGVVWNVLNPLVTLLKDSFVWVIKNLVMPVIAGMVDKFNTLIANLQTGYNWLARLVPGMEEVAAATTKASDAGYTFSDYLNGVGEELPVVSTALAGGSVGESLAPSAAEAAESIEKASESMRDFALTTDVQWAAYQRLWEIGTPVNDVLVSQKLALDGLAGVVPGVTSGFSGLTDGLEEQKVTVEEQESTWSSFGEQVMGALRQALGAVGGFATGHRESIRGRRSNCRSDCGDHGGV